METKSYAWKKYPEPKGVDYTMEDFCDRSKVIEIFDYCQILQAVIWAKGWQLLFEKYGLKGIVEIDSDSGWLNDEDLGEWISKIIYHSLISGFEPIGKEFGTYDETTGIFINSVGVSRKIDWQEIYNLKDNLY